MRRLAVFLQGVRVGLLTDGAELRFAYDDGWLESGPVHALGRQLPLRRGTFSGRAVRAFFGGLLPEGEPRERVASNLGVSSGNDFALLERVGGDCAGAVSVHPEGTMPGGIGDGGLRWLEEEELAGWVARLPQRPLMAGEGGVRLSLAGAQVKVPVVMQGGRAGEGLRWALPTGGTASTHILKPEPTRFPGLVANEAWCMGLAARVGLPVASCHAVRVGQTPCLVVQRYDRAVGVGGAVERLHQEDFCQALGLPPSRKYQQEGGPSLRDCVDMIREWSSVPVLDLRSFVDGVVFAVLTGNADAHAKNFSWLYSGTGRRMAPLYDQVCTLEWPELSVQLSMKVGSAATLNEVVPGHFEQLARVTGLGWPMLRARMAELCERILECAADPGLPSEVVRGRAQRMRRLLG